MGANENPPNASAATGFVTIDVMGNLLTVDLTWNNLEGGNPAAAHIHCCIAPGTNIGVAVGFPSFPTTLSGSYLNTFDLTDPNIYTANFRNNFGGGTAAGAAAALLAGLDSGLAYVNIHNTTYPGGEIRADVQPIPEPSTLGLAAGGLLAVGAYLSRRRVTKH